MSAVDAEPFPRGALMAAGALVGFSLLVTTVVRLERLHAPPAPVAAEPAPARSVLLRFVDEPNGAVNVLDGEGGRVIAVLAPDTNGFIRGVMRGLAHDRTRRKIGAGPPFRLSQWSNGRLAISDPATGRVIDLDAFGGGNKDAFVQLLHPRATL
jgi:putative photosynthetic complex assembly protein